MHHGHETAVDRLKSPVLVAALTASSSWSYLGLKATVKAQSTMCPLMCVPKSAAGVRGQFVAHSSTHKPYRPATAIGDQHSAIEQ